MIKKIFGTQAYFFQHPDFPRLDTTKLIEELHYILSQQNQKKILAIISQDGSEFALKLESFSSYNMGHLFKPSMAKRAFNCFENLRNKNINVRCPIHFGWWERRRFGFAIEWGISTEFINDSRPIHDFLRITEDLNVITEVSIQLGEQLGRLHLAGLTSNAIDETNIIIQQKQNNIFVWILDFEHCRNIKRFPKDVILDLKNAIMLFGHHLELHDSKNLRPFLKSYSENIQADVHNLFIESILKESEVAFRKKWGFKSGYFSRSEHQELIKKLKQNKGKTNRFVPVDSKNFSIRLLVSEPA